MFLSTALLYFLTLAQGHRATVYGLGENKCGNPGNAKPCVAGQITYTGERFDPTLATAAIPIPKEVPFRPFYVHVRDYTGTCRVLRVNDKSSPRWVGRRGLDLTPAAVFLITGKPATKSWSGVIQFCT